ncbi:hypothetical protein INT45_008266 [Circinella minor]|uniref:Uncharacterized protein n=1 Tax=Circinella minor TaxID=1195481 RepID=A0A8H7S6K3_9FUNG|nr:hypothetical protein INT45_008266 [Circinella minor]
MTSAVAIASVLRDDIPNDLVYNSLKQAAMDATTTVSNVSALVRMTLLSLAQHNISIIKRDDVQLKKEKSGFDIMKILPKSFTIRNRESLNNINKIMSHHLGNKKDNYNDTIHPLWADLIFKKSDLPSTGDGSSITTATAVKEFNTNLQNMWSGTNIYAKSQRYLIRILLRVHLAPEREQKTIILERFNNNSTTGGIGAKAEKDKVRVGKYKNKLTSIILQAIVSPHNIHSVPINPTIMYETLTPDKDGIPQGPFEVTPVGTHEAITSSYAARKNGDLMWWSFFDKEEVILLCNRHKLLFANRMIARPDKTVSILGLIKDGHIPVVSEYETRRKKNRKKKKKMKSKGVHVAKEYVGKTLQQLQQQFMDYVEDMINKMTAARDILKTQFREATEEWYRTKTERSKSHGTIKRLLSQKLKGQVYAKREKNHLLKLARRHIKDWRSSKYNLNKAIENHSTTGALPVDFHLKMKVAYGTTDYGHVVLAQTVPLINDDVQLHEQLQEHQLEETYQTIQQPRQSDRHCLWVIQTCAGHDSIRLTDQPLSDQQIEQLRLKLTNEIKFTKKEYSTDDLKLAKPFSITHEQVDEESFSDHVCKVQVRHPLLFMDHLRALIFFPFPHFIPQELYKHRNFELSIKGGPVKNLNCVVTK